MIPVALAHVELTSFLEACLETRREEGDALFLSWWLPVVQVQNMMQGQDPLWRGPPLHAPASCFCRLLHSAPEAVALRRDPAHPPPRQHQLLSKEGPLEKTKKTGQSNLIDFP